MQQPLEMTQRRACASKPMPAAQFRARYWPAFGNGHNAQPFLPLTLEEADTLTGQKLINNMTALSVQQKKMALMIRDATEAQRRETIRLEQRLNRLEALLAFTLCLFILLAVTVGLLWKALP